MTQAPAITRKLTTILAADAANYSGRMAQDEVGTVQALRKSRLIFEKGITSRSGRVANTAGDGLIAEFPSVVEAVAAAVSIQKQLQTEPDLLPFRIGLHLGDVIVDGDDLLGDGVNLAARLQDMAREGGILATQQVVDHAKGRLQAEFRPLGLTQPKHLPEAIPVYAVVAEGVPAPVGIADVIPSTQKPLPTQAKPPITLSKKAVNFRRHSKRNYLFMSAFAVLDIITGSGFGWCVYPVMAFGFLQAMLWINLSDTDKAELKAIKANKAG